ncbi:unnamed protein product [Cylicostephanus goldi]|uniref:Uncharacterized protein n=1 Tax=Cylicostephanus goldi TaxID=71465 RepID=A0A3P6SRF9_CYLGO|nr:unnamed protein product [Cylicostephanus goldi]
MSNYYYSKTSYDEYSMQSGVSPRGIGFPAYYYPTAFQKQPNYPLSPRQAQAIQRQAPDTLFRQPAKDGDTQRQNQLRPSQQPIRKQPEEHQKEKLQPTPRVQSPPGSTSPGSARFVPASRNHIPDNYLSFIAAPTGNKFYGDYPELVGDRSATSGGGRSPETQRKLQPQQHSAFGTFPKSYQPPKLILQQCSEEIKCGTC